MADSKRFGADILQWKAVTTREYMRFGINQSSGFYVISGAIMLLLSCKLNGIRSISDRS